MNELIEITKQAVDAFSCAETVAQLGMLKVTGAVAVYTALIHENDKKMSAAPQVKRDAVGREI